MQKIQPISKSKKIDYGNKVVNNFWLKTNDEPDYQDNNNLKQIMSVFDEIQDGVICIQTEEFNHPEIIKVIFSASKRRNRIYILTNKKDEALKQLEGVCLIRYGIKNIGSFILVNSNASSSKGVIFTAPFTETGLANSENISLSLSKEQIKILFRFFSDNFWNKAEFEIIDDFSNSNETDEPPLDFLPNIKDFCDTDFVKSEISKINSGIIASVPSIQTNDLLKTVSLKNSKIITNLKDNDDELLINIANNNDVYAIRNNSLRLIIGEDGSSWLIPKTNISTEDNLYALKLNKTQETKLKTLLNKKTKNAEFEFNLSKTRKELENKTIISLNNVNEQINIKQKSDISANSIELKELLPRDQFENQEPEFIDDNVSVQINYSWQIIPFFTPNNAKKAKLYEDWDKLQNEYDTFLKQIENAINESGNKSIGDSLKRWFLGKKQTLSKQRDELESLKNQQLSNLEISKRKEAIKQLNELAKDVSANLSEIDNEINKLEIKTEIDNLKKQKENKEVELNIFIEEQEKILKEKEENKDKLLAEFLEKYKIKKDELNKYKSEWHRKKKKKKEKIAEDHKKLEELNEIQGFDFSKKYEAEKQKIEKEIKNIGNKITSKEKELEKIGKEQHKNESSSLNYAIEKGQNNKKSNSNNEFNIPDNIEYLPKIGELFEVGKQKYLEIQFWENFELGNNEAKRLNAKLSAKKI